MYIYIYIYLTVVLLVACGCCPVFLAAVFTALTRHFWAAVPLRIIFALCLLQMAVSVTGVRVIFLLYLCVEEKTAALLARPGNGVIFLVRSRFACF